MRTRFILVLVSIAVVGTFLLAVQAADAIPSQYTDAEFWRMVNDFSEPDGQTTTGQNYTSNEISYQNVLPELTRLTKPGGIYLGVGPEQNFTYAAALKPKVAFIIDIRRQNMILHLMYKALFEIAPNRAESRRVPVETVFAQKTGRSWQYILSRCDSSGLSERSGGPRSLCRDLTADQRSLDQAAPVEARWR
jgi:hypothetical protein